MKIMTRTGGLLILLIVCFTATSCSRKSSSEGKSLPSKSHYAYHSSKLAEFAGAASTLSELPVDSLIAGYIREHPKTPVIESDSVFSLYWFGKAQRVLVNGDLQSGWAVPDTMKAIDIGEEKFFYISYIVPPDSRLDYTFTIDSTSVTDPRNPDITPSGYGPHSEIAMPGFKPDGWRFYREDVPHGRLDSMGFTSKNALILPRQLKIYLPAGYDSLTDLPVIFILDGLEALEFMSYRNVLDNLVADGKIEPVIAVFIPPGEHFPEKLGEKTDAFLGAVCDEMVPLIDRTYKTAASPGKRAITGISSGGHFAFLAMFCRPDVFHCVAGQSATLTDKVIDALHTMISKEKYSNLMKIYADMGIYDLPAGTLDDLSFLQASQAFDEELQKLGIHHVYKEFRDGHEWANWRERTDDILVYFFGR